MIWGYREPSEASSKFPILHTTHKKTIDVYHPSQSDILSMNHFISPGVNTVYCCCSSAFPSNIQNTRTEIYIHLLLNRYSIQCTVKMHTVKGIGCWEMCVFMDSNKLQNYENISSSDQSQIWLPFITSTGIAPFPPHPFPSHQQSWFKCRNFRHFFKAFCVSVTKLKL